MTQKLICFQTAMVKITSIDDFRQISYILINLSQKEMLLETSTSVQGHCTIHCILPNSQNACLM